MVSDSPFSVYFCEFVTRGRPTGEGADTSWTCRLEVFGYHLKPEQRDTRLGSQALCCNACP
jgi:hypothetical protein